jgi:hypothetical protein
MLSLKIGDTNMYDIVKTLIPSIIELIIEYYPIYKKEKLYLTKKII